ncbi:RHS repeat-associated core domain-containing protein, partial [Acidobacteriota bacterium]
LQDTFGNSLENEFTQDFTHTGADLLIYDRDIPRVELIKLISREFFITFTEEINPSSITGSVELTTGATTISGTTTTHDTKTIKFVPTNNLTNNTDCQIKIKADISDLSGRNLSEFTREFRYISGDLLIYEKEKESEHEESVVGNNVLFQGRNYDKITGLYYFRARYFHPKLGRFLQTDPMGYQDSMNTYQGFNQNPVNYCDPMGMISGSDPGYSVMNRAGVSDDKIRELRYYETRFHTLFAEGATNAAIKTFLIPANYLLFPIKMVTGLDFDVSVNFSEEGSFIRGGIKKKDRIDIVKDQSLIYPIANSVTQTGQDFYFGFMHQGGQSSLAQSSRENLVRSAGATGFNIVFWGSIAKSGRGKKSKMLERPKSGSLSNIDARIYYNSKLPVIKKVIDRMKDRGASRKEIAESLSHLRNVLKTRTRAFMKDRALAESLPPVKPFAYYVKKYSKQGLSGNALYDRIIEGALTPNSGVNAKFGIK